jgi:purine-nucleoside phosphorylase
LATGAAAAADALRERLGGPAPDVVLVLGSGLSALAASIEEPVSVPFTELPGLPAAGVAGHPGRWIGGRLEGRRVLAQAGRYHLYEGHALDVVRAPVGIAARLGAGTLILTNAAGAIRPSLGPGALMRITGHLDLMQGAPPLTARAAPTREPYDPGLGELAARCARALEIPLAEGVYAGLTGPSYETPAEIRALARLGADVVGMSTVPESAAAHALGMRCLAVSLVTNHAAGIGTQPLDHAEVIEIGRRTAATLERLLRAIVRELPAA